MSHLTVIHLANVSFFFRHHLPHTLFFCIYNSPTVQLITASTLCTRQFHRAPPTESALHCSGRKVSSFLACRNFPPPISTFSSALRSGVFAQTLWRLTDSLLGVFSRCSFELLGTDEMMICSWINTFSRANIKTHTHRHTPTHTRDVSSQQFQLICTAKKGEGPPGKGNYYRWLSRVMCRLDWCRNGKQHLIEHKLPAREIFKVENRYIRQMFSFSQGRCSLEQYIYFALLLFFRQTICYFGTHLASVLLHKTQKSVSFATKHTLSDCHTLGCDLLLWWQVGGKRSTKVEYFSKFTKIPLLSGASFRYFNSNLHSRQTKFTGFFFWGG